MWMRYVFKGIIVVAIFGTAFYVYTSREKEKEEAQAAVEFAEKLAVRVPEDGDVAAELFKILVGIHEVKEAGRDPWEEIEQGIIGSTNSVLKKEAVLLKTSVQENYNRLVQMGVFEDKANIVLMGKGQAPSVKSGGYSIDGREFDVVAVRIISPLYAPEARNALPNIILAPEPIALMQVGEMDQKVRDLANKWRSAGIIEEDTYKFINDEWERVRRQK